MNERIKQLIEQSGFLNKDEESIEYFAELIVKECIDICEQTRYEGKVAANRIKFVFGLDNENSNS